MIPTPLSDQLAAERKAAADARNEQQRRQHDPALRRSPEEAERLRQTAAAVTAAEAEAAAAMAAYRVALKAVDEMGGNDWTEARWAAQYGATPPPVVKETRAALEAWQKARERLEERNREHRAAVREVSAAGMRRRSAAKVAAGQLKTAERMQADAEARRIKENRR